MRVRCCFSCFQFQIYENILLFRFNFLSSYVHFFLLPDCDCTTKLWACAFFSTWILCSVIIWIHYIKCFFGSAKNPIIVRRDFQSTCIEDIKRIETPDLIYIFMQKKTKEDSRMFKNQNGEPKISSVWTALASPCELNECVDFNIHQFWWIDFKRSTVFAIFAANVFHVYI